MRCLQAHLDAHWPLGPLAQSSNTLERELWRVLEQKGAVISSLRNLLRASKVQVDGIRIVTAKSRGGCKMIWVMACELRHERTVCNATRVECSPRVSGLRDHEPCVEHGGECQLAAVLSAERAEC